MRTSTARNCASTKHADVLILLTTSGLDFPHQREEGIVGSEYRSGSAIFTIALNRTSRQLRLPRLWLGLGACATIGLACAILLPVTLLQRAGIYHGFVNALANNGAGIGRTFLLPAIWVIAIMVVGVVVLQFFIELVRVVWREHR